MTAEERRHAANRERLIRVVGGCSRAVEFVIRGANLNCAAVACEADSPPLSVALLHTTLRLQLQHISDELTAGNKAASRPEGGSEDARPALD